MSSCLGMVYWFGNRMARVTVGVNWGEVSLEVCFESESVGSVDLN